MRLRLVMVMFLVLLSFSVLAEGEEDTINWNKNFSSDGSHADIAYSVAVDSNNNVYVVGYGWNLSGISSTYGWWIKKFNPLGTEDTANWNKIFYGGGYGSNIAYSVAVDSNNNVYIVGHDNTNTWRIKKFNSSGTEDTANWNKRIYRAGDNLDVAYSVAVDSNNNVYVVGYGYNLAYTNSNYDWWLKKFNSSGTEDTTNWNKNFSSDGNYDAARSVAIDSNNNMYVIGEGYDLAYTNSGSDWWIKKFNSSGMEDTANWNKNISSYDYRSDAAYFVAIDSNNNVYVVGYGINLAGTSSARDWWIKKFNSSGTEDTTNWNKNFSSAGTRDDAAYSVAVDSNNNVYVVGYGESIASSDPHFDWWIKKFNSSGTEDTTNWNKNFTSVAGGDDIAYSTTVDFNNNVYVVGYGTNLTGSDTYLDWWIKKFTGSGNPPPDTTLSGCAYNNPSCASNEDCINNQCVLKTGCDYNNPPCGSNESCTSNQCVPSGLQPPPPLPTDLASFDGVATTPAEEITNPASVASFTLENNRGKVTFTQNVDISRIAQIAPIVVVQNNRIAINTAAAPQLNKAATLSFYNTSFRNPLLLKSPNFNAGPFTNCPATECRLVSNANNTVTFTVTSFSTYQVQEQPSVGVEVVEGEVFFAQALREQTMIVNITVRNSGANQTLTGLRAELVNVANKYAPQVNGLATSLAVGQQDTATVQITVPLDEPAGKHNIGALKIRSNQIETSVPITISPKSFLALSKFEVNEKSSGNLELNTVNKISVTVKNDYTQDMEDVTVTITILDIGGEDLEEELDSFDLNDGNDKEVTVEFDLTRERLDEEKYTVKVTVEGTAKEDNTEHQTEFTQEVEVERENHKVILQRVDASPTQLECSRQIALSVTVENIGKNDEEEVEIHLSNSALGLAQNRAGLKLDAFDGSDNEYKTSFQLNIQDVAAGTYPVKVDLYRDGNLADTKEVVLTVKSCTPVETIFGTQAATTGVSYDLAPQIQPIAQLQEIVRRVSSSFRDSPEYTLLLGGIVILLALAVVLGLAVLAKRK